MRWGMRVVLSGEERQVKRDPVVCGGFVAYHWLWFVEAKALSA